ncbi:uncharacterized protein LOC134803352 [Cydia splendana]|uniref:uncharacterized protein LOC134803352 n=1 Tax=Cydia splendana TaxID=1100963 RepID=UPI0028F4A729
MVSAHYVIIGVIATLLGNVFIFCSAQDELIKIWNWIFVECREQEPQCLMWCVFEKMEIVKADKGVLTYQESRMLEWLKFPVDIELLTQDEANQIAAACTERTPSVVNANEGALCQFGQQVQSCFTTELNEILLYRNMNETEREKKEIDKLKQRWDFINTDCISKAQDGNTEYYDCKALCLYRAMEVVGNDSLYVESKMLEWMKISIFDGIITQAQAVQIAAACNRVNNIIYPGCKRGEQVELCIVTETAKVKEIEAGTEQEKREPGLESWYAVIIECRKSKFDCILGCLFNKMGVLADTGRYDESRMLEWMKFPVDIGVVTENQAKQMAEECYRVNGAENDQLCARGQLLWECLNDEMDRLTGKRLF